MNEQTRYRVTGSLFLLAVAIIGFPMLFDGGGLPAVEIAPLEVVDDVPRVASLSEVAPKSDFVAKVDEFRAQVDTQGYATTSGTRFGEPVLSEAVESTGVLAVQVASFVETDNAVKLRNQLREQGYEAFITTVRKQDNVLNRVAVGPLLSEAQAQDMQQELAEQLSLDVRVVAFSN